MASNNAKVNQDDTVVVTLRVPRELAEKLEFFAKGYNVSRNVFANYALEQVVNPAYEQVINKLELEAQLNNSNGYSIKPDMLSNLVTITPRS